MFESSTPNRGLTLSKRLKAGIWYNVCEEPSTWQAVLCVIRYGVCEHDCKIQKQDRHNTSWPYGNCTCIPYLDALLLLVNCGWRANVRIVSRTPLCFLSVHVNVPSDTTVTIYACCLCNVGYRKQFLVG